MDNPSLPDTEVDVHMGRIAAGRLQAMIESRASGTSMVDMLVKMDRVINAIKSTVPEEMWGRLCGSWTAMTRPNLEPQIATPWSPMLTITTQTISMNLTADCLLFLFLLTGASALPPAHCPRRHIDRCGVSQVVGRQVLRVLRDARE